MKQKKSKDDLHTNLEAVLTSWGNVTNFSHGTWGQGNTVLH